MYPNISKPICMGCCGNKIGWQMGINHLALQKIARSSHGAELLHCTRITQGRRRLVYNMMVDYLQLLYSSSITLDLTLTLWVMLWVMHKTLMEIRRELHYKKHLQMWLESNLQKLDLMCFSSWSNLESVSVVKNIKILRQYLYRLFETG